MDSINAIHPVLIDAEGKAVQFRPTCVTQGIASLNVFSDLLMYLVIENNKQILDDEAGTTYRHVSEKGGGLVISFSTMRDVFLLRDMFWEAVEKAGLLGHPGMDFDGMEVIGFSSAVAPGLITWGPVAAVRRTQAVLTRH